MLRLIDAPSFLGGGGGGGGLGVVIHTYICGPFTPTVGGYKYFITFIDDYSC